jgi:hypothetical protein
MDSQVRKVEVEERERDSNAFPTNYLSIAFAIATCDKRKNSPLPTIPLPCVRNRLARIYTPPSFLPS